MRHYARQGKAIAARHKIAKTQFRASVRGGEEAATSGGAPHHQPSKALKDLLEIINAELRRASNVVGPILATQFERIIQKARARAMLAPGNAKMRQMRTPIEDNAQDDDDEEEEAAAAAEEEEAREQLTEQVEFGSDITISGKFPK